MMSAAVAAPESFEALYRERWDPMVRLAYLLTGSQAIAEELVQDAFVSVHRSWSRSVPTNPSSSCSAPGMVAAIID